MAPCWLYILLLNYLHPLNAARDVVDVYVQLIKYRVDFFKIGFYPNIFIETWLVGDSCGRKSKSVH
jgi:hypothetical protein